MFTVFFYNFILFSSAFFVWLSDKISSKAGRWLFMSAAFCIILLPSALRYDVGTDFFNYIHIYEYINDYENIEKGFYYVNILLRNVDADPQWMIVTLSSIFTFVFFLALPDKDKWLIFFVFTLTSYFISFNQIRQAIAIAFTLLSVRYFLNKELLLFVIALIIGGLFHKTALLLIPVGLVSIVPLPKWIKFYFIPFSMVFTLLLVSFMPSLFFGICEFFLVKLELHKYANYFSSARHFVSRGDATNIGVLVKLCLCLYFILLTKIILTDNDRNIFIVYMIFLYSISTVLAASIIIFIRMQSIFIPGLVYAIYLIRNLDSHKKINSIIITIFLLFFILSFIKSSFSIPSSYSDPNLNPYKSIITE